jgi:hypothetical protein
MSGADLDLPRNGRRLAFAPALSLTDKGGVHSSSADYGGEKRCISIAEIVAQR